MRTVSPSARLDNGADETGYIIVIFPEAGVGGTLSEEADGAFRIDVEGRFLLRGERMEVVATVIAADDLLDPIDASRFPICAVERTSEFISAS